LAFVAIVGCSTGLAAQDVFTPQPFPKAGAESSPPTRQPPPSSSKPAPASAPAPAASAVPPVPSGPALGKPTNETLGIPGIIYPTAEFLEAIDLGQNQHCYLFGTNLTYAEMVAYYKQVLKDSGRELFRTPATQQFDLGKFQEDAMVTPPSVVIKDYSYGGSQGYLHVVGTRTERFKTIIQIVPMPGQ
jgi:hypothetical protein